MLKEIDNAGRVVLPIEIRKRLGNIVKIQYDEEKNVVIISSDKDTELLNDINNMLMKKLTNKERELLEKLRDRLA